MRELPVGVHELLDDPGRANELTPAQAAELVVELARVAEALRLRALAPVAAPAPAPRVRESSRLVTQDEAVQRSGKSWRWFRDHWREVPGKKVGRSVAFEAKAFDSWLARP